jgi:hypothetical protein
MSLTQEERSVVIEKLAEAIAKKSLGIEWHDTESQARRVAEACAESLFTVTIKAAEVKNAETSYKYNKAVNELIDLIVGEVS